MPKQTSEEKGSGIDLPRLWKCNPPALFVALAIQAASAADELYVGVNLFRSGKALSRKMPAVPPVQEWMKLYHHHRRLINGLGSLAFDAGDGSAGSMPAEILSDLRQLSRMSPAEQQAEVSSWPPEILQQFGQFFMPAVFPPSVETLTKHFENEDKAAQDSRIDAAMTTPEGQFLLRVWIPCFIEYQEYPTAKLRYARSGRGADDLSDLEDLLRLDKSVLADPVIAQRWHEEAHASSKARFHRLVAAVNWKPKGELSKKKIREYLAAYISQLAIGFKLTIDEGQIRKLFNNISFARTGYADQHLPGQAALAKAIQRSRNWPSLPKSDKNHS